MKTKFLFILLSVLFVIPTDAAITKKKKSHLQYHTNRRENVARTPLEFDMTIQSENSTLNILFRSPLPDAEITVIDKDGNVVINQPQTSIYEGKMLIIHTPNAYPYTIEITSPTMDITGEIVQE